MNDGAKSAKSKSSSEVFRRFHRPSNQVRVAMKSFYCFYIFHKVLRVVVKEKWRKKLEAKKAKTFSFVPLTYKYLQRRQTLDVLKGFDAKTFKSAVLQYQTLQRSQPDEGLALDRE